MPSICPTPDKTAYTQHDATTAAAVGTCDRRTPLGTYRCGCGWWHLTSNTPSLSTRIRKALK